MGLTALTPDGEVLALLLAAFAATAVLTAVVRRFVHAHGWLDIPNARSSHVTPTARGGGLAIVVVVLAGAAWQGLHGRTTLALAWALVLGGGLLAAVGLMDDRRPLSAPLHFAVQCCAMAGALAAVGGLPPVRVGNMLVSLGWAGHVLVWLACLWFLNLFNFMDGIDGIAAAEAAFVSFAAAWLAGASGAPPSLVALWLLIGAASLGFLVFNWPPARIFMGDVGSGFLGFAMALLLVVSTGVSQLSLWTAVILTAPFVADATVTLARRVARRERWYIAHRSHAYQWLARRWGSHARVTGLCIVINLALVLPAAWLSVDRPRWAPALAACTLGALLIAAAAAGAGRPERAVDAR